MPTAAERREELKAVFRDASVCVRCPQLADARTQVVFGAGNADADLMFIGEAPGRNEDEQGVPFVGAAGKLLEQLLGEIGLARSDVFIANALKCLRYNAQVQLGDGSWVRIGRLVRSRYSGTVMSVDEDGALRPRRVTGWHATPVGGRRVFKLSFRSAKPNGNRRAAIELTGDHPVLTSRGYVAVQELLPGDLIATGQGLSDVAYDAVCGTLPGDGCLSKRSAHLTFEIRGAGRQALSEIATNGFSEGDRTILRQGLLGMGLPCKSAGGRLFFDVVQTRLLSELIAPLIPPTMRYKLVPDVEVRVQYDPSRWERGPQRTMWDEVDVQDVTDHERLDTTFFCLDVEGTHNFVTSGGVVHNCRPPGNRDPLPQEIANCQDWLYRQLELIAPKVVCTLGNFSTKLLRGDTTGITRLHGQPEVRVIGPRAVRLMPLYHPAAALYTRSLLETLREDFARIPALLALEAPEQPEPAVPEPVVPEPEVVEEENPPDSQLGLF